MPSPRRRTIGSMARLGRRRVGSMRCVFEDLTHPTGWFDEQVHAFWHEDPGNESAGLAGHGAVDGFGEKRPPLVGDEEGQSSVARKRQLVEVAGFVETMDGLPVSAYARKARSVGVDGQAATVMT